MTQPFPMPRRFLVRQADDQPQPVRLLVLDLLS